MSSASVGDHSRTISVTLRQALAATRSRIWRACTDPAELGRWQADRAEGRIAPDAELLLSWPTLGIAANIAVLEVVPERRLVLQHGATEVTFSVGDGALELTQSGLPDQETADGVASSWRLSLAVLGFYLQRHDGRDRRVSWHVAETATTADAAHVYFTDAPALAAWLTHAGGIGPAGAAVELDLAWRSPQREQPATLSGEVLANTPGRDLALSWHEQNDSVIALRTLPSLRSSERLLALSWSRWAESAEERHVDDQLAAALSRLQRVLGGAGSA